MSTRVGVQVLFTRFLYSDPRRAVHTSPRSNAFVYSDRLYQPPPHERIVIMRVQVVNNLPSKVVRLRPLPRLTYTSTLRLQPRSRAFSTTPTPFGKDSSMPNTPPKHEMVHFPQLASSYSPGEFRKVLHTGLYSQVVAMEIPVGGDIGEEVSLLFSLRLYRVGRRSLGVGIMCVRSTRSIKRSCSRAASVVRQSRENSSRSARPT